MISDAQQGKEVQIALETNQSLLLKAPLLTAGGTSFPCLLALHPVYSLVPLVGTCVGNSLETDNFDRYVRVTESMIGDNSTGKGVEFEYEYQIWLFCDSSKSVEIHTAETTEMARMLRILPQSVLNEVLPCALAEIARLEGMCNRSMLSRSFLTETEEGIDVSQGMECNKNNHLESIRCKNAYLIFSLLHAMAWHAWHAWQDMISCALFCILRGPLTIFSVTAMSILCIVAPTLACTYPAHTRLFTIPHTNAFLRFLCACLSLLFATTAAALIAIAPLAPVREMASNLNSPSIPETLTPSTNKRLSPVLVSESFQDSSSPLPLVRGDTAYVTEDSPPQVSVGAVPSTDTGNQTPKRSGCKKVDGHPLKQPLGPSPYRVTDVSPPLGAVSSDSVLTMPSTEQSAMPFGTLTPSNPASSSASVCDSAASLSQTPSHGQLHAQSYAQSHAQSQGHGQGQGQGLSASPPGPVTLQTITGPGSAPRTARMSLIPPPVKTTSTSQKRATSPSKRKNVSPNRPDGAPPSHASPRKTG